MTTFPRFLTIRQRHNTTFMEDVESSAREALLNARLDRNLLKGARVGIAVGSRGISNIPTIVKAIVEFVYECGGSPVVFAAMGTHGNGEAAGQREMLYSLGINESFIGCDIVTNAKSRLLGETENGLSVYVNTLADTFDRIILVNRVKPHTDFEDITESGIYKLMAIGMGNPEGAMHIHERALAVGYGAAIRDAGNYMLKHLPIALALAVTENWKHETDYIEAILPEDLAEAEPRILAQVKANTVRLPFDELDTLIIYEAGKNISGTCVDTKVVGRIYIPGQKEPESPRIKTITALDFTDESHGNSMGLGVVDIITRRAFDKIDIEATSLTGMTSTCLRQAKIPCAAPNDYMAIETAIRSTGVRNTAEARVAYIHNTNLLQYMAVSESLIDEIKDKENIEILSEPYELEFDDSGALKTMLPH